MTTPERDLLEKRSPYGLRALGVVAVRSRALLLVQPSSYPISRSRGDLARVWSGPSPVLFLDVLYHYLLPLVVIRYRYSAMTAVCYPTLNPHSLRSTRALYSRYSAAKAIHPRAS